jgi:hypothetical protein
MLKEAIFDCACSSKKLKDMYKAAEKEGKLENFAIVFEDGVTEKKINIKKKSLSKKRSVSRKKK